jgi:hypothetical protein
MLSCYLFMIFGHLSGHYAAPAQSQDLECHR